MPIEYLIILLVATSLECAVAWLAGFRTLRYQQAIALVNLFTIPPLSYATWVELVNTIPEYLAAKLFVTIFEVLTLMYVLRTKRPRLIIAVILMNTVTFIASVAYAQLS